MKYWQFPGFLHWQCVELHNSQWVFTVEIILGCHWHRQYKPNKPWYNHFVASSSLLSDYTWKQYYTPAVAQQNAVWNISTTKWVWVGAPIWGLCHLWQSKDTNINRIILFINPSLLSDYTRKCHRRTECIMKSEQCSIWSNATIIRIWVYWQRKICFIRYVGMFVCVVFYRGTM
jgi:hypothetical protein